MSWQIDLSLHLLFLLLVVGRAALVKINDRHPQNSITPPPLKYKNENFGYWFPLHLIPNSLGKDSYALEVAHRHGPTLTTSDYAYSQVCYIHYKPTSKKHPRKTSEYFCSHQPGIYVSSSNHVGCLDSFEKVSFSGVSGDLLRLLVGQNLHKLLFSFSSILTHEM